MSSGETLNFFADVRPELKRLEPVASGAIPCAPWPNNGKGPAHGIQLAVLMDKMRSVEAEIETELAKRREEMRFSFEKRRIVFEQEALRIHLAIKTRASRYLIEANPLIVLSAPVIYSLIVPIALARHLGHGLSGDLFSDLQNPEGAPPRLPGVRPSPSGLSQHHRKFNCAYCSYCNGAIAFVREVASRTEVYWCPIKHARRVLGPHPHYAGFADFGDAEGFRKQLDQMKDGVKIEGA